MSIHDDAQVGLELPVWSRPADYDQWNRFAAVNDEFVPWHMDDGWGRDAGFPRAIGMGRLSWSYLHNALRDWVGDDGRVVVVDVQFRAPQLRGDRAVVRAVVTGVRDDDGRRLVDLDVRLEDGDGAVLVPGTAVVELAAP